MRTGRAHPVPLIVGTNADEARLFTRFLKLLPTTEHDDRSAAGRGGRRHPRPDHRGLPGLPGTRGLPAPRRRLRVQLGGLADRRRPQRRHAPTYVYRYDYAPRPLRWSGLGATHATELFAVFDMLPAPGSGSVLTAAGDRKSARRVSRRRAVPLAGVRPHGRTGRGLARVLRHADRAVMVFDRRSRIEFDPHAHRRSAWDGFTLTPPDRDATDCVICAPLRNLRQRM